MSECDGAIREIVIHYVPEAAEIVVPTYRDFLRQLPGDVVVRVVCCNRAAFDDLAARVAPTKCTLSPVIVDHPITGWSRAEWLGRNSPHLHLAGRGRGFVRDGISASNEDRRSRHGKR